MRPALALMLVASAAVAPAAAAAEPLRAVGSRGPLLNERLSDEFSVTRFARVHRTEKIRKDPKRSARSIARLRYQTEDGPPEVYLVLRARRDSKKRVWIQIRVPGRPNGRKGWVRREALGPVRTVRTHLRINRTTLRATLYKAGKTIWSSPVGIGAKGTETPRGRFWIRDRLKGFGGSYGPFAFATAAYSKLSEWPGGGVIGIHGTDQPGLIPGRPSHGCIRVPNFKVVQLERLMPVGTSVQIL